MLKRTKKLKRRSPIREIDKPLRLPGQSLQNRLYDLSEKVAEAAVMIGVFAGVCFWSGFTWLFKTPEHVEFIVSAVFLLGTLIYYVPRFKRSVAEMKRVKQGRDGERYVADILDEVKVGGGYVLHDLVAGDFNLDHVLITRRGVYAIETKTLSKLEGKQHQLEFDGKQLKIGSQTLKRDPLAQARGNAKWLSDLLERTTGKTYPVRPVVLFPGWFIKSPKDAFKSDVWVLNPKALAKFVQNESMRLEPEQVLLALEHLKSFSRRDLTS